MKSYGAVLAFFGIFALLCCTLNAEVVQTRKIPEKDETSASHCTIHEVRITPCAEAATNEACRLKRGEDATIEFDFTPDFTTANLTSAAFWVTDLVELPFRGLGSDACAATPCPTTAGQKQSYRIALPIAKAYPNGKYDVKWKVATTEGDVEKACIFVFRIKLYK